MIVNIDKKNENPVLNRTEIKFSAKEAQKTPSRKEIKQKIIALINSDEKLTVIDVLETRYGTSDLKGTAKIYKDEKQMKKIEEKYILARNFGKKEEAKAENKTEAPAKVKEEAPVKKEEVKAATKGSPAESTREGEGKEKKE